MSRIFAPLLSLRGAAALLALLRGLLLGLAAFFLEAGALAVFLALGAPFFWVAPFFPAGFAGATCALWVATLAAVSLVSEFVMVIRISFCALVCA